MGLGLATSDTVPPDFGHGNSKCVIASADKDLLALVSAIASRSTATRTGRPPRAGRCKGEAGGRPWLGRGLSHAGR